MELTRDNGSKKYRTQHREACFRTQPRVTGTAPVEASSGKTRRHRLNRGGNRI
jgi:hypothetical protein